MRKLIWIAVALFVAVPSHAQTSVADVSAGYSYFRLGGSGGLNMNGVSGSGAINANNWLGVAGDLGYYHASPGGVGFNTVTYTVGPRFSYRMSDSVIPVVPFAEALIGGAHLSASSAGVSATSNPLAFSFGGGADIGRGKIALRPQVDYFGLRENGFTTNSVRITVGLVFHVGQK